MTTLTPKAVLEQVELSDRAQKLSRGNASDRAEAATLVQRVKVIGERGISSDEARERYTEAVLESATAELASVTVSEARYLRAFHKYVFDGDVDHTRQEHRDLVSGQQTSIVSSAGPQGGYLIPLTYQTQLFTALSQTDELLSGDVCDFTMEPTTTLQPQQLSGFDLSTISASLVGEDTLQSAGTFPAVSGRTLRGNIIYKVSIAASIEAEDDVPRVMAKFAKAYGVAFARKLGADAVLSNPDQSHVQGILSAIPNPVYSTGSGKVTLGDIESIVWSVNYAYRAQPLAGFLASDTVIQRLRAASDNNGRPLIGIETGEPRLLGFPIHCCPSLGIVGGSPASNSTLIFGDLGAFHIRCSRPTLQRVINSSTTDITSGRALYVARVRMDSALFDPSNGSAPPCVSATITA